MASEFVPVSVDLCVLPRKEGMAVSVELCCLKHF